MTPRRRRSRFRPPLAPSLVAAETRTEQAGRTERALLVGIGRGEQTALLELYRRHGPLVYAAARRAGGPSRAETVTRAVFLRLWANPGAFRPGHESLRSFLFAQAHADAADPCAGTPQGVIDARHEGGMSLLAELPEQQANTLALIIFGGCTFREAAALLEQPEPLVRSRAMHALRVVGAALNTEPSTRTTTSPHGWRPGQ